MVIVAHWRCQLENIVLICRGTLGHFFAAIGNDNERTKAFVQISRESFKEALKRYEGNLNLHRSVKSISI